MKPATFADVDGDVVEVAADLDGFLVWLKPPAGEPLAFDATTARALAYALINGAEAVRFPPRPPTEQAQE